MRIIERELKDLANSADPEATSIIGRLLYSVKTAGNVRYISAPLALKFSRFRWSFQVPERHPLSKQNAKHQVPGIIFDVLIAGN